MEGARERSGSQVSRRLAISYWESDQGARGSDGVAPNSLLRLFFLVCVCWLLLTRNFISSVFPSFSVKPMIADTGPSGGQQSSHWHR